MLHYTPPQLVEMDSSTLSPFAKGKRFSTSTSSQDKQQLAQPPDIEPHANPKRSSKLNDFISRTRTASLPPRPHTSNGPSSSKPKLTARLGTFKSKGKEPWKKKDTQNWKKRNKKKMQVMWQRMR